MDFAIVGIVGICLLLLLVAFGIPIGFSLATVGIIGTFYITNINQTVTQVSMIAWNKGTEFTLLCLPLFVLMGQLVSNLGIGEEIYDCVKKWFGRLPGGLAITTVIACAMFGAMTGGSIPAIAVFGPMVLPEMKKANYDDKLATGSLSAAGTLAVLIPPSFCMVFYGILTDTSIGGLFLAGIIPGIIMAIAMSFMIYIRCVINPALGPKGPSYPWGERFASLTNLVPALFLFVVVIGGIYGGLFSPTEASGIGVVGVLIIGLVKRKVTLPKLKKSLHETGVISSMVFVIIMGGFIISRFLVVTEITQNIIGAVSDLSLNKYVLILVFILIYLVLGAVLDVYGMLILTIPFMFPIVMAYGFDPIWFGIFVTIMTELALITPPIGLNIYLISDIVPDTPVTDIIYGSIPFIVIAILMVGLLLVFPEIATYLPYR